MSEPSFLAKEGSFTLCHARKIPTALPLLYGTREGRDCGMVEV